MASSLGCLSVPEKQTDQRSVSSVYTTTTDRGIWTWLAPVAHPKHTLTHHGKSHDVSLVPAILSPNYLEHGLLLSKLRHGGSLLPICLPVCVWASHHELDGRWLFSCREERRECSHPSLFCALKHSRAIFPSICRNFQYFLTGHV